jgi:hypothetical protein
VATVPLSASGDLYTATYAIPANVSLKEQGYEVLFRATDNAGNTSESTPHSITVDRLLMARLTVGSATARPGETVTLPITLGQTEESIAGFNLTIRSTGNPPLIPAFAAGAQTVGWISVPDPNDPWHFSLANATGVMGPAEVMKLSLQVPSSAPLGTVYDLNVADAILATEMGQAEEVTPASVSGRLEVSGCASGDVNGNGTVDIGDAILALRMAVLNVNAANPCGKSSADVNCNGGVDIGDAILILRNAVLKTPFPACR